MDDTDWALNGREHRERVGSWAQESEHRLETIGEVNAADQVRTAAEGWPWLGSDRTRYIRRVMLFEFRDARLVRFHIYANNERALAVARQAETSG
jgi:hypothetical protein